LKSFRFSIIRFHRKYFYSAVLLFLIEFLIAVFLKDQLIRSWMGDVLVVMLIHCSVLAFLRVQATRVIASVFIFACTIEGLQYFNLVNLLGMQDNRLWSTVIGTTFDWKDILAYLSGSIIILGWERKSNHPF
jgi:Protein of unknown function (DUF2809)